MIKSENEMFILYLRNFSLIKYIQNKSVQMFGLFVYFWNVIGRIFSKFVTS